MIGVTGTPRFNRVYFGANFAKMEDIRCEQMDMTNTPLIGMIPGRRIWTLTGRAHINRATMSEQRAL
jgi:hypothetical protein